MKRFMKDKIIKSSKIQKINNNEINIINTKDKIEISDISIKLWSIIFEFIGYSNIFYLRTINKFFKKNVERYSYLEFKNIYSYEFFNSEEFRKQVKESVYDISKQLSINLSNSTRIIDLSTLRGIHTLDLSRCRFISDVSPLIGIHTLNLSHCYQITNVSALAYTHTLNLSACYNITDVSMLGNVRNLNLSECTGISDVSMLGKVINLNLSFCVNISDVSKLINVHTLDLYGCTNIIDVSNLKNVHTLDLRGCTNIRYSIALENISILDLEKKSNEHLIKQIKFSKNIVSIIEHWLSCNDKKCNIKLCCQLKRSNFRLVNKRNKDEACMQASKDNMLNKINYYMIFLYLLKIKIDNLVLFPNNKLIFYMFKSLEKKSYFNDVSLILKRYDAIINYFLYNILEMRE